MHQAQEAITQTHEQLHEASGSDGSEDADPWLEEQVAQLAVEQAAAATLDPHAYRPQFMDEHEMQSLRRRLRTSEARVRSDGHLREFALNPRRAVMAVRPTTCSTQQPRARPRPARYEPRAQAEEELEDPFLLYDGGEKREYAVALREEVDQLNQLNDQYEETKRMLLDHLDMVCLAKPSERVNGQDAYETLDELLVFAAKCAMKDT